MPTLDSLFQQFLRERSYLKNVSPKTRIWYETAWATFLKTQPAGLASLPIEGTQPLSRQHLNAFVVALRDRGVRPVTCNTWLRALNAYCRCLHDEGVLREPGFHRLRHTLATEYLKHGGDVVRLCRILDHTEVGTTMEYLHLVTSDPQAPHQRLSILNRPRAGAVKADRSTVLRAERSDAPCTVPSTDPGSDP